MTKRRPPKIRMAPAEPAHITDQDSSWYTGMEWSLDSRANTDWWNIRIERRTRTPDRIKQKDAGLRKKGTPLLRDMMIQMAPITIMVRLINAKTAAARFKLLLVVFLNMTAFSPEVKNLK